MQREGVAQLTFQLIQHSLMPRFPGNIIWDVFLSQIRENLQIFGQLGDEGEPKVAINRLVF